MSEVILTRDFKTPYGELILGSFREELCLCDWKYRKMRTRVDSRIQDVLKAAFEEGESAVIESTIRQLNEYFEQTRSFFELPLLMAGSEFQKKVWEALTNIPFGTTTTYGDLAQDLNDPKAIRAIASANGANALAIIIPCHRVIGATGELFGYAGGLSVKKRLLNLEGALETNQVSLF